MDLTHRFSVPASRDEAWQAFADLEKLAPCFPGATITSIDGDDFTGSVKIKLGPIALVYTGTGTYAERDEASARLVIDARGKDKRGNGTASAKVSATFIANGDHTDVEVSTDLSITGKPAQFGRGVISDVSDKLLDQFVTCVSGRFVQGFADPEPDPAVDQESDPEPTVELGEGPGAVEDIDAPETAATPPAPPPAAKPAPSAGPAPQAGPYSYKPPTNSSQPDFNIVATVAPVLLKRYWPVLAGSALAFFVINKILKRRGR